MQLGLKTGSTSLALYNLSASATRNGLSLIAVIMKAPTTKLRFSEAQKLLDYVPDLIEKVNNMLNKQFCICLFNILFTFSIKSGT